MFPPDVARNKTLVCPRRGSQEDDQAPADADFLSRWLPK